MNANTARTIRKSVGLFIAAIVLTLVFASYFSPDLAMRLALQIWSCF